MHSSTVLPAAVRQLIALFEADLEGVAFPDVDLAALQEHAKRCVDQAAEVAELEAKLAAAQVRANERSRELAALATKAVAYASVYAADDAELSAKLQALDLDRNEGRATRRGPKRKGSKAARASKGHSQGALGLSAAPAGAEPAGAEPAGAEPAGAEPAGGMEAPSRGSAGRESGAADVVPLAAGRAGAGSRLNTPPQRTGASAAAS